jgi:peptidoglycan/LPS O-acetylase OafA/YrhL
MTTRSSKLNFTNHMSRTVVNSRNSWIDILRGLAIFSVVGVHSIQQTNNFIAQPVNSAYFSNLISLGKYGVEVFFFLSGWILGSIYGFNGNKLGRSYAVRRIARIYPLWIFFLIISLIVSLRLNGNNSFFPLTNSEPNLNVTYSYFIVILMTLTFTLFSSSLLMNTVIFGGWSIQVEVAHYFIFPIIRNRPISLILKAFTAVNCCVGLIIYSRSRLDFFPKFLLSIIDSLVRSGLNSSICYFLIGLFAFMFYSKIKESKSTNSDILKEIPWLNAIFFLLSIFFIPCPFGSQIEALGYLAITILIIFCVFNINALMALFKFLGKYSYFTYFIHFYILFVIVALLEKIDFMLYFIGSQQILFLVFFSTTFILSIIFAIPSMKFIEAPILKFAHRIK